MDFYFGVEVAPDHESRLARLGLRVGRLIQSVVAGLEIVVGGFEGRVAALGSRPVAFEGCVEALGCSKWIQETKGSVAMLQRRWRWSGWRSLCSLF